MYFRVTEKAQQNKHKEIRLGRRRDERTVVRSVHSSEVDEVLNNSTDSYSTVMTDEGMKSSDGSNISGSKKGKTGKYRLKLLPTKQNYRKTRSKIDDTNLLRNRRSNVLNDTEKKNISTPTPSIGAKHIQVLSKEKSSQNDDDFLSAPCTPRDLGCSGSDKPYPSQTLTACSTVSTSAKHTSSARALHSIAHAFLHEDDEDLMLETGEADIDNDEFWKQTL